jgi:hypothetical protein
MNTPQVHQRVNLAQFFEIEPCNPTKKDLAANFWFLSFSNLPTS